MFDSYAYNITRASPRFFFFLVLEKIRPLRWKKCYRINKITKFEGDLLKTNEDVAPQSRETLQFSSVQFILVYIYFP